MNVIGDIGGRYDTLLALLKQMPDDEPVSLGDMVDRGHKSKEVLDFFMNKGRAILGNHEHMMLDYYSGCKYYDRQTWIWNGGNTTVASFNGRVPSEKYLNFLAGLPLFIKEDGYLITHGIIRDGELEKRLKFPEAIYSETYDFTDLDNSVLWNRINPAPIDGVIQIYGHNSYKDVVEEKDENGNIFGYGIDTGRGGFLTGFNTKNGQIYKQPFVELK